MQNGFFIFTLKYFELIFEDGQLSSSNEHLCSIDILVQVLPDNQKETFSTFGEKFCNYLNNIYQLNLAFFQVETLANFTLQTLASNLLPDDFLLNFEEEIFEENLNKTPTNQNWSNYNFFPPPRKCGNCAEFYRKICSPCKAAASKTLFEDSYANLEISLRKSTFSNSK